MPQSPSPRPPGKASRSASNSDQLAKAMHQQELLFEQRMEDIMGRFHLASAAFEQLQQEQKRHQQAFEQAKRDNEQLQHDASLLRALLQASQDALLHRQPLTAEQQRWIDEALHPSSSPADDRLAA